MNSATTYKTTTHGPSETIALGEKLGARLQGGEVIELASDLGGGKTTMAQGIAKGLGYDGDIVSPTFTISRVYQLSHGRELQHYDFYRLEPDDITAQELAEAAGDESKIVMIEWAGHVGANLPKDRLSVSLIALSETDREITFSGSGRYAKIIKDLKA